ncbi:glycoside hydrolase family 73 protein [Lewinella sp. JB7]|uniref:glycoside hydrolase family 73 protein n=1 Tax=Lewinella sp. JB7 TaxID=2962887 RepID=UPI0020C9725C|nr:glucosaminidase domain-containing protein [Lewinella sp. JB7]MCP9235950.1 glucosaminidase domain-containing protein [Lewinella sp. JB7]
MPANPVSPQPSDLGRRVARLMDYAVHYSIEILLIALIIYLCVSRGVAVRVDVHDPNPTVRQESVSEAGLGAWFSTIGRRAVASLTDHRESNVIRSLDSDAVSGPDEFTSVALTDDPAPHISNLTLVLSPDYGERKKLPRHIIQAKRSRVSNYVERYAPIARREMRDHGIPASITLAQGLLESNAGDSKLAVNSNNHFGIKCRAKCLGCTCRNYGDDTRYDMFRVFGSVEESFQEHSTLLNSSRYAKLKAHGTDYSKWAHGLKACGYATDRRYAQKLITIIENLQLDRFDVAGA